MAEPVTSLPRDQLIPWPGLNPRRMFEVPDLEELRESIAADGLLQPVGVTLQEEPPHWIYAGERRWRAAEGILEDLPVVVRDIDEATARRLALSENIQRSALTAVEEAEGIEKYIAASGATQTELAEELGKSQSWISNRLRLLRLPSELRELIQDGKVSATQARDLLLPFSKLEQWEELAGKVASYLRKLETGTLSDEQIRLTVSNVAVPMSGWMDRKIHGHEDTIEGIDNFLTLEPKLWKTAPKGTLVQYSYGHYQGGVTSTRCFDAEWWLHAMRKETRRRKVEQEERQTEDNGPDLEWSPDRGPIPGDKVVPYSQRHVVFELNRPGQRPWGDPLLPIGPLRGEVNEELYSSDWSVHVDPFEIPASQLVLQEGTTYRLPAILCTKEETYLNAMESMELERSQLYEKRIRTQAEADLERASKLSLTKHLPAIIAAVASHPDLIEELAGELELELPERGHRDLPWGHAAVEAAEAWAYFEWLQELEPVQLQELVALAVERLTDANAPHKPREGYGLATAASIQRSINFELRHKYRQELESKVSFPLPTHPKETEDDAESV